MLLRDGGYRAWLRRTLSKRQGGKCCYCRRMLTKKGSTRPTLEHKQARMDGGSDDASNLLVACFRCNQHRGRQVARRVESSQTPA